VILLVKRELFIEKIGDIINGLGRRAACDEHRNPCAGSHVDQFLIELVVTGQNDAWHPEADEIGKSCFAFFIGQVVQIARFSVAENLYPLIGKQFGEPRYGQAGTMKIAFVDAALLFIKLVETPKFYIEPLLYVFKKIGDRDRSLLQALLVKIHARQVMVFGKPYTITGPAC